MTDPYKEVLRQQYYRIRDKHGCSACAMRGKEYFGKYLCAGGLEPGRKGYCMKWWLHGDFTESK